MKRIFLAVIILMVSNPLFAQNELKSTDISKFARTFEISSNELIGQGA